MLLLALPLDRRCLPDQGGDRGADLRARRLQPQLPDRHRRDRQLRPCRLLRPRRLRGRAAGDQARRRHGAGAARRAADRRARRGAVRLLHRAAVGHLPRHADAGVRADHLRGRLPVGGGDGRRQRRGRRVAVALGGQPRGLLLPGAAGERGGHRLCCGGPSTRRSATRCARRAIPACAPMPSASTCARTAGWRSRWPVRRRVSPAGCSPSPRARSTRR